MKVVFLTSYFYPEVASTSFLLEDLISRSTAIGNDNILLAPNPVRELDDKIIKENKKDTKIVIDEKTIMYRLSIPLISKKSRISRVIRMFFMIKRFVKTLKKLDFDIIVTPSNPPVFLNYKVYKVAKKKGAKVIYNVQDIFPDNTFKKGMIYNGLNHYAYKSLKKTDLIVTLSTDMKDLIISKGIDPNKIRIIENWGFHEQIAKEEIDKYFKYDENKVNVSYIGNIGEWQNIDLLINASQYLDDDHVIHLIGGGRRAKDVEEKVKKLNTSKIRVTSRLPLLISSNLYALSDANLISLNNNVIFCANPSKTAMCVKANRPIIAVVNSESKYAEFLKTNCHAVIVNPTDSPLELAKQINMIKKDVKVDNEAIFNKHFEKEVVLKQWEELLSTK